jgi:shingomyelin synthase
MYDINKKTSFIIILFLIVVFVLTQLGTRSVTEIAKYNKLDTPLPDLFHNSFPDDMRNWHEYTDWMPFIPLILFITLDKGKNLLQFLFLIGVVYVIRFIAFSITILPAPSVICECEWETEPETFLRRMLNILYQEGCNDLLFSGHTSLMLMSTLFLIHYCLDDSVIAKLFLIMYNILGIILIIGTKLHYSVDVYLATIITTLLFFSFNNIRFYSETNSVNN